MSGIFISYRHEGGLETAKSLAYRLEKEGYKVFFDKTSMRTGPFDKQLFKKIDECSDFIIILDPNVFKRTIENGPQIKEDDWLAKEIDYAHEKGKNIIPIELPGYSKPENDELPKEIRDILLYHNLSYSIAHFEKSFYSELTESLKTPNPIKSKASKSIFPIIFLVIAGIMGYYISNIQKKASLETTSISTDTIPTLFIMGGGSVWNYINSKTKFKDSLRSYHYIYLPMASTVAWSQIRELRSVPDKNPNKYSYHLVLLSAKKADPEKIIPENGQQSFRNERGYVEEIYVGQSRLRVAVKKGISINNYLEILNGDTIITINKLVELLKNHNPNLIVYTTNEESGTFMKYDSAFKAHSFGMDSIIRREQFIYDQPTTYYNNASPYIILEADTYSGKNKTEEHVRRYFVYDENKKHGISNDLYIYFVVFKEHNKFVIPEIVRGYLRDIGIVMPDDRTIGLDATQDEGLILSKPAIDNKLLHPTK